MTAKTVFILISILIVAAAGLYAQSPVVVSVSPDQNELNSTLSGDISATFNTDMNGTTINAVTFLVSGSATGVHQGTISYDNPTRTATFGLLDYFASGEVVTVMLAEGIQSAGGDSLEGGYMWSFTTVTAPSPATFRQDTTYDIGNWPWEGVSADFDGDGDMDLATVNNSSNGVSILLNHGDGSFAMQVMYPVSVAPASLVAADLDQDGDVDIAASCLHTDLVSVILNNGNGTFSSSDSYPAGDLPEDICAGDFDGDGDLDLATVDFGDGQVTVLLNDGDGTFSLGDVCLAGGGSYSLCSGDFDNDGDVDLATANMYDDNISILMNVEDTLFDAPVNYATGNQTQSICTADLDGDGYLDIVVSNVGDKSIWVYMNDGNGTLNEPAMFATGDFPLGVFPGDIDGDGDIDIAVAASQSHAVYVHLNDGDGSFSLGTRARVGRYPSSVFAGDFDGDNDLDLAAVDRGSDSLSILFNRAITDNILLVTDYGDSGKGTLRWAIDSANNSPGVDSIEFAVNGVIQLESPLPSIEEDSTWFLGSSVDGYPNRVAVDGSNLMSGDGFVIHSSHNLIEGLLIRRFPGNGIVIVGESARFNTIRTNSIYDNGLLGIDLGDDGVTLNDPDDLDSGPNDLLNFPVVDSLIRINDTMFTIFGRAVPDGRVELYFLNPYYLYYDSVPQPDPSGYGEGNSLIGADSVDASGYWSIYHSGMLNWELSKFNYFSLLVTDVFGNSSEFSENYVMTNPLQVIAHSPVNLRVTDPEGGYIGRDEFGVLQQTIIDAEYPESGPDDDDIITLSNPIVGEYIIEVIPEYGTVPGEFYAIGTRYVYPPECMLVVNAAVPGEGTIDTLHYTVASGWHYTNGDADRSGEINILDATYIINYLYKGGFVPNPIGAADVDCDLTVNILDVTGLINYLYKGGSAPCAVTD